MLLAEIFMLRLETATREAATDSRFVPITLPAACPIDDTPQALVSAAGAAREAAMVAFAKSWRRNVS
jgi:hypothetical protein